MTYGLHPSIWRRIRKNHSGLIEMPLFNKQGIFLGNGIVSRYRSTITLVSDKTNFKEICFKTLIKDTEGKYYAKNLKGDNIRICNYYLD